jgi:hypothetical protein
MENTDRPPLTTITESGLYRLKMTVPKFEKVRADGKCFSKSYGTKYAGSLALLVGKISGKYTETIRGDATAAEFIEYVKPACGKPTDISVEVTPNGEWNGKPQYKYKLTFPKGSQTPAAPTSQPPGDDSVPF